MPAGLHTASRLPAEGALPSLHGATGWLNSPPLTPAGLRGQVVVADFWTYTCVNWLRQLPYVRAWAQKYASQGLVLAGGPSRTSTPAARARSTTTTRYGARLTTTTGRRCTSPTRRGSSAITTTAR